MSDTQYDDNYESYITEDYSIGKLPSKDDRLVLISKEEEPKRSSSPSINRIYQQLYFICKIILHRCMHI